MLLEFSLTNFRSFKEKTTLNMRDDNGNPMNISIFMGANASGKSNFFMAMHISKVFINTGKTKTDNKIILYDPYLRNKNEVSFEYVFKQNEYLIKYSFSIKNNKNTISKEELSIGNDISDLQVIYSRNMQKIKVICSDNEKLLKKVQAMNQYFSDMDNPSNILFLTMMFDRIAINTPEIKLIKSFFNNFYTSDINVAINANIDIFSYLPNITDILSNDSSKKSFLDFLKIADSSVKDININKKKKKDDINLYNTVIHEISDETIEVDFSEESGGIRVFSGLFTKIDSMLKEKRLYIIDELDIRLHYDLLSYIIYEINKNNNGSQLIFSCHNIGALYWDIPNSSFNIIEKENGNSSLSRISDIIGNEDNRDIRIKNYMRGKLGGFPDYDLVENSLDKYKKGIYQ